MSWRSPLPPACWDSATVSEVFPVEAEQRSDVVFLAVHSPLPLFQRSRVDSIEGEIVDESALVKAVEEQPIDYPILPILGTPGSGKSHLVRWLRLTMKTPDTTRKVFIPKRHVSLRGIVQRILQYGEGDEFDELRSRVDEAIDALTNEHEARLRLRASLATLVEIDGVGAAGDATSPEERSLREHLADRNSLPALLLDPWFRDMLLSDNSALSRIVKEKLEGKGPEDKHEGFGFTGDDFLVKADDMGRAAPAVRSIVGDLASDSQLQSLAAQMLNEQLERATSEVFGLGGEDLKNILISMRHNLAARGEDLLLLVEDFTLFQGFQGGLIDAMTLIPSHSDPICGMRAVLAVTPGYWTRDVPDTMKDRTYTVFDLDLPSGTTDDVDIARFVAPYLNAVRLGTEEVERRVSQGDSIESRCLTCPVVAECHDAFGDVSGVGLFPFNLAAMKKATASQLRGDSGFNARAVLNRVLRPVLHSDHAAIADESFPTEAFASRYAAGAEGALDIEDEARLERQEDAPEVNERRKRLIRFWGSANVAENLHPTIHKAFAIPTIEGLRAGSTPRPDPAQESKPEPEKPQKSEKPALVDAVDRWIETGELTQRDRRDLRRLVHSNILARLELEDGRYRSEWWSDTANGPPIFTEDGILLGDERTPTTKGLVLLQIPNSGESARALRALAWSSAAGSWRAMRDATRLQRLALATLDEWTAEVRSGLFGPDDRALEAELDCVIRALHLGSQMLGIDLAFSSDLKDRLAALMLDAAPGDEDTFPDLTAWRQDVVTGRTATAFSRADLRNRMIGLACFSQGGAPLALDLPRISPSLEGEAGLPDTAETYPEKLLRYLSIQKALAERADALYASMTESLPDTENIGAEIEIATATIESVLHRASSSGKLPAGIERALIDRAGQAITDDDIKLIMHVRDAAARWSDFTLSERLRHLSGDWYGASMRVRAWMEMAQSALDRIEEALGASGDTSAELDAVRSTLTAAVNDVIDCVNPVLDGDEVH